MRYVIYYRGEEFEEDELAVAKEAGFYCTPSRMDIQPGDLVIPRYSYLPFAKELEADITRIGARLINSYKEHRYIADLANWYDDLRPFTPKTWFRPEDVPQDEPGAFFLKGETNSKKFLWDTHAYAKNRADIGRVLCNLQDDSLINQQSIYVRKFEEFEKVGEGFHGLPITREYRFFFYKTKLLSEGYYWASHCDQLIESGVSEALLSPHAVAEGWLHNIAQIISYSCNFFVIDIATKAGDFSSRVVELNDGTMAGLSMCSADELYGNLMAALVEEYVSNTAR